MPEPLARRVVQAVRWRTPWAQRDRAVERAELLEAHVEDLAAELHQLRHFRTQVEDQDLVRYVEDDPGDTAPFLVWAPPGHFYSAIPSLRQVEARAEATFDRSWGPVAGVGFDEDAHAELLARLAPLWADFDFPDEPADGSRYHVQNGSFEAVDGRVHWAMLQHLRPKRLIEVGSGWSSALTLEAVDRHLGGEVDLTFVEPYPDVLESVLADGDHDRVRVLAQPVQEVDDDVFRTLEAGDVLFIDDSHVAKVDSDVCDLFFRVLPLLASGVWVHVHDMFWPFQYPEAWIREGRTWNELYLVRAFLQFNDAFEIAFFSDAVRFCPRLAALPEAEALAAGGGSLWLRRR